MNGIRGCAFVAAVFALLGGAACTGVSPLAPDGFGAIVAAERSELTAIGSRTRVELVLPDGVIPVPGSVQWSTSDASVADVDLEGLVTAVGDGETIITGRVGGMSASTTITVAATIYNVITVRSNERDTSSINDSATVLVRVQAD